jgi:hypothetical protein
MRRTTLVAVAAFGLIGCGVSEVAYSPGGGSDRRRKDAGIETVPTARSTYGTSRGGTYPTRRGGAVPTRRGDAIPTNRGGAVPTRR